MRPESDAHQSSADFWTCFARYRVVSRLIICLNLIFILFLLVYFIGVVYEISLMKEAAVLWRVTSNLGIIVNFGIIVTAVFGLVLKIDFVSSIHNYNKFVHYCLHAVFLLCSVFVIGKCVTSIKPGHGLSDLSVLMSFQLYT